MLSISPIENKDVLKKCDSDTATVLMCTQDGVENGYIAFEQNGYVLDIVGFEVYYASKIEGQAYVIADALLRSLGSYAMNHSCFYIECSKKELYPILSNFDFTENDDKMTINLQQLFKVCKK